jgi:hypothetical protein
MVSSGTGVLIGGTADFIQNAAPTVLAQIAKRAILAFNIEASGAVRLPSIILKADSWRRASPVRGMLNQPSNGFENLDFGEIELTRHTVSID